MKRTRLRWFFVSVLLIVVGLLAYAQFNFQPNLTPITGKSLEPYAAIGKLLEAVKSQPSLRLDDSSIGYPESEGKLRALQQAVSVFQGRFHRLPKSLDELPQIFPDGAEGKRARKEMQRDFGSCTIFTFTSDSYALNCDALNPDDVRFSSARPSYDQSTIKFYAVDHHVIIYVPPRPR